ncbi:MAG: competence protein CoiA [Heteroscytonema crispum UTEX LB 1556]
MKYALANGIKQEPKPQQKGVCCFCGNPTISKCGNRKVWHWAHESLKHCDSWWENETSWHRLWKSYFPVKNQEIIHFDEVTGEKHIADIKTDNGMVIEIQNSPMSEEELHSRESFYGNMIWIVNGEKFRNNFTILDRLPKPFCEFFEDIVFLPKHPNATYIGLMYYRKSENFGYENWCNSGGVGSSPSLSFSSRTSIDHKELKQRIEDNYEGHHLFKWKNSRTVWFQAEKPVFIDFGGNRLWQLRKYYDGRDLWCVQKISKAALIRKNGGEYKP